MSEHSDESGSSERSDAEYLAPVYHEPCSELVAVVKVGHRLVCGNCRGILSETTGDTNDKRDTQG